MSKSSQHAALCERGLAEASKVLEREGLHVIDRICGEGAQLVAEEGESLVFARAGIAHGCLPEPTGPSPELRSRMEADAISWIDVSDRESAPIRFDSVRIAVLDGKRSLCSHERDILSF